MKKAFNRNESERLNNAIVARDAYGVRYALSRGANPDFTNPSNQTCLHQAVQTGFAPAVRLLIEHGANVNAADSFGFTPLHIAALCDRSDDRLEIVEWLLQKGADPKAENRNNRTPAFLAGLSAGRRTYERLLEAEKQQK